MTSDFIEHIRVEKFAQFLEKVSIFNGLVANQKSS